MMRYFELPQEGGQLVDLSMALLDNIRAAQMPMVEVDNSHFLLVTCSRADGGRHF